MDKEWKIEIPNFGCLRICPRLLTNLRKYRQLLPCSPESGGVLVGKFLNSGGSLLINDFTPPQKSDKQKRCLYDRSDAHNKLVQQIWTDSDHYSTYVGLWHTHPEGVPNYSSVDRRDWMNALNNSKYEGNKLYFFIVGQTHIRSWVGTKKRFNSTINLLGEYKFEK